MTSLIAVEAGGEANLISLSLILPLSFRPSYLVSLIVVSLSISGYFLPCVYKYLSLSFVYIA